MSQIEIAEAVKQLESLLEAAIGGEEIVITRDNQPIVKLVPIAPKPCRKAGSAKGLVWIADDFNEPLELVPSSLVRHHQDTVTGKDIITISDDSEELIKDEMQ